MKKVKNILFISPHTDDVELGAGGTLVKFLQEGKNISVAAFSSAAESLKANGLPEDQLIAEFNNSMKYLGVSQENRFILDFPVRRFGDDRQKVLDALIKLKKKVNPDLVIIPSKHDIHQDHQVLHNESLRAFKHCNIWCYELPWNQVKFEGSVYVDLSQEMVETKIKALSFYESQVKLSRPYFDPEFIKSLAVVRGCQSSLKFAEAFELIREYY